MKRNKPFNIEAKVNIHNKFDIVVEEVLKDANGNYVLDANGDYVRTGARQEFEGFNTIVNNMWTRLCGGLSYFVNIHFGTGIGTPASTDTALFAYLGTKAATDVEQVKAQPTSRWKRKIVLNPEEFVGSTITEVAIAYGSGTTNIVNHAMLKDSEENQISIGPKTDTQIITIYATVFISLSSATNELTWLGVADNTNQLINFLIGSGAAPTGSFGLKEGEKFGVRLGSTTSVSWTSDVANKKRKTNLPRFDVNTGNGHVMSLEFTNLFNLEFPATGIHEGLSYNDVPIGVGDGVKNRFTIPSRNIKDGSIVPKLNGIVNANFYEELVGCDPVQIYTKTVSQGFAGLRVTKNKEFFAYGTFNSSPFLGLFNMSIDHEITPISLGLSGSRTYGQDVEVSEDGKVIHFVFSNSPYHLCYEFNDETQTWNQRESIPITSYSKMATSADGNTVFINKQVYDWNGTVWTQRGSTGLSSSSSFVNMSADGNSFSIIIMTSCYFFDWNGSAWIQRPILTSLGTGYLTGRPNSNLDKIVLSEYTSNANKIRLFEWDNTQWVLNDSFDLPVAANVNAIPTLSDDGNRVIIGLTNGGSDLVCFERVDGELIKVGTYPSVYGISDVRISSDGSVVAVQGSNIYIFDFEKRRSDIIFDTAPDSDDVISSNYITKGVHKTINYIIDASFSIQFGEGA